jgi:hypothetical protein
MQQGRKVFFEPKSARNAAKYSSLVLFQMISQTSVPSAATAKQKPSEKHEKLPEMTDNLLL